MNHWELLNLFTDRLEHIEANRKRIEFVRAIASSDTDFEALDAAVKQLDEIETDIRFRMDIIASLN